MSQVLIKNGHQQAKKLLTVQALILVVVAAFGLFKEFQVAVSLLSGGLAVFLANLFFVHKAFSLCGAQASKQVVAAFYFGETVKIILSAGLLTIAFLIFAGYEVYALAGYIVALLCQWLAPIIIKTH